MVIVGKVEELVRVSKIVRLLLEEDERCRNDDKWLTYRVMRFFTNIYIPFEDFSKLPSFESVSRCRRKIRESGEFLADDPVVVERREREGVVRAWAVKKYILE